MKTAIRNLFGMKASAANRVILSSLALPGAQPHLKFDKLAKESYERNSAVYAVVHGIATAASTVQWIAYERSRSNAKGVRRFRRVMTPRTFQKSFLYAGSNRWKVHKALDTTEVSEAPVLKLIERPNPLQAQAGYVQALAATWLIAGNGYEEFIADKARNATPREMYVLRPDRVSVLDNGADNRRKYPDLAAVVPATELVLGYEYTTDGGQTAQYFPVGSVIHRKNFHPTEDFYGLSPLMPARRAWETDNLAADWNKALIKNQARPSGALVAPMTVGDDSYARLKAEIQETYLGEAGLPIFLEGGLDWKQLSFSPIELDWLEGRGKNREEVCAVYGWPVELIGGEKKFNTFAEARKAGWTDAVLPLLDAIRDEWNARVAPHFGDAFVDYDRDQIDALAEDAQRVYLRVASADWLSVNEQRDATGYESTDHEDADTPRAFVKGADPFGLSSPANQLPNDDAATPEGDKPLVQGEENPMNPESGSDAAARKTIRAAIRGKGQNLNVPQRRALNRLRVGLRKLFAQQGTELAAHAARAIREEL